MTTLVRPDAPADGGGGGEAPQRTHEPSRYAAWRSSWAVALRMARRDVRRHKGRSALIVVMVTVPTLLLSALVTIAATTDVAGPELIGPTMGTGQALLKGPSPTRIAQGPTPNNTAGFDDPARPIPGFDPDAGPYANADAVVAARRCPRGADVDLRRTHHRRRPAGQPSTSSRSTAARGLGDKLRLVSGRWPQGTTQALVTAYGDVAAGCPTPGAVTVTVDGDGAHPRHRRRRLGARVLGW